MKTKKHPKANLENYSKLFVQLGLVLSLFVAHVLINQKTFAKEVTVLNDPGMRVYDMPDPNVIIKKEEPPKPKPVAIITDEIEKADNDEDINETIFKPIDFDEPTTEPTFDEEDEPEEIGPETVPFLILENAPVFPGCKGTQKEIRACFEKKMSKFIQRKFNANLAADLGLAPGVKKIFTLFKIDENGKVTDIQVRAPHKSLEKEALRVINLLPTMEPGKQRGNAVIVKYSQPIAFKVE